MQSKTFWSGKTIIRHFVKVTESQGSAAVHCKGTAMESHLISFMGSEVSCSDLLHYIKNFLARQGS